ncbi:hypothetical protein C823_002963 [Eubacterium plexicaudatum ASF492]|uniref:MobA/MobL protein domain-containing protein n=1 Tax=Eubacterium plexicaudatum ASF492 TaxID=1235802 RepID=N2ACZ4_9FIRM|nr:hypothetical protein C823_002963 [Eubacterium plexicaudatum ASF492]
MVVPIADAYYEANNPKKAGKEKSLMCRTAKRMKRNYERRKQKLRKSIAGIGTGKTARNQRKEKAEREETQRNLHIHVLLTMRPLTENWEWGANRGVSNNL